MRVQSEIDVGYERFPVKFIATVPIKKPIPTVDAYAIYKPTRRILLGYHGVYDCEISEFEKHILSVGYKNQKTELSLKL